MNFQSAIRNIPDFPKKGIGFKDITTLLLDPPVLKAAVKEMAAPFHDAKITKVIGIESRGFIFGMPLALELGVGFVPIRKPGKLPAETISESYELEYGSDSIEIHRDALNRSDHVLIVDDLLATGGTMEAAVKLVEKLEAQVTGLCFLIELNFLGGRKKFNDYSIFSLVNYDAE